MPANQTVRSHASLVDNTDRLARALGQVVSVEDGRDVSLGQCWLAAPNKMVTCGHVVDRFRQNSSGLFVYFPSSGARYAVSQVALHPSFVRQPDGLVKFDVALLSVNLAGSEAMAQPLPFAYENSLRTNDSLWTIRYPVHLGQLSAALEPLSQDGQFLGLLRKHDNFHLLHDLPLAPGDSGSPITDGKNIVAIHCGDTATLPGLNLPTTSIRMALWVDALRDLGLAATSQATTMPGNGIAKYILAFVCSLAIGFAAVYFMVPHKPEAKPVALSQPALMPVEIKFNEPLDAYKPDEVVEIYIVPKTPCYPFLFLTDEKKNVVELYPGFGAQQVVESSVQVDQGSKGKSKSPLTATQANLKLYAVAVDAKDPEAAQWVKEQLVTNEEWLDKDAGALSINENKLLERINNFQSAHPGLIFFRSFDVPKPKA